MATAAPRTHLAESLWISRTPLGFRELCERAVPPETRLLVLDLDRTLHLGRNMGELLGWEISAYHGYGPAYLTELEPHRGSGRFYFDRRRPLAVLRYLWRSGRVWGPPGLFYLLWGKLAARVSLLKRRAFRRFGLEPVAAVQRIPQDVLFSQMLTLPAPIVRELGRRVWQRHRPDQTIEREDLEWLRRRCPGIRIVLSSASPREMVEIAAEALGIEDVVGSSPDRINGGRAKLAELRARYPVLSAPGAVTVGISDTGYGEDHCWTEAFTHVVDVNSTAPFPPIVLGGSPLRAVFSAPLLTRAEKAARARGERALDRRRGRAAAAAGERAYGPDELATLLAPARGAVERLAAELQAALDENERRLGHAVARGRADVARLAFLLSQALERSRRLLERRA